MITRRDFLKLSGATLILATGGSVFRAMDQGVFSVGRGPAYEPWVNWRDAPTAPERIVAAGILAANPHNSQPWFFRLTASTIDLFADPARQIGVIDPFRREMYLGLGCALENMILAVQAEGFAPDIQLMPDPSDPTHVVHLSLITHSPLITPLFNTIPIRHTNRAAYDTTRPLLPEHFTTFDALITEPDVRLFWFKDAPARTQFSTVALAAAEALIADEQQSLDSHQWWRQDWDQVQTTADGITLDAQGLGGFITGLAKFLPDISRQQGDRTFVQNMREIMLPSASAFGLLAVPDGTDNAEVIFRQRLNCGRAWQRLHLWATTQGLAMQPLNQMCERDDRERQLGLEPVIGDAVRDLVGENDWHAVMPFRVGYPTRAALPSPRRGLGQVVETG